MRRIAAIVALTASAAVAQTQAPLERIFDLPFDAPLDREILPCPSRVDFFDWCISPAPSNGYRVYLVPPETTERPIPTWARSALLSRDDDNKVIEIVVTTPGVSSQDRVIQALRDRFGKPSAFARRTMTTRMGVKADVISAEWKLRNAFVVHTCDRLDECIVIVQTSRRRQQLLQESEQDKKRDKL